MSLNECWFHSSLFFKVKYYTIILYTRLCLRNHDESLFLKRSFVTISLSYFFTYSIQTTSSKPVSLGTHSRRTCSSDASSGVTCSQNCQEGGWLRLLALGELLYLKLVVLLQLTYRQKPVVDSNFCQSLLCSLTISAECSSVLG